jgi:hypothetical protein
MIGADFAQNVLPLLQNLSAQSILPQKGAPLPFFQNVMAASILLRGDFGANFLPQRTGKALIALKALLIHVDFPAHAAGVFALVRNAPKALKTGQHPLFHLLFFPLSVSKFLYRPPFARQEHKSFG